MGCNGQTNKGFDGKESPYQHIASEQLYLLLSALQLIVIVHCTVALAHANSAEAAEMPSVSA